MCGSSAVLQEWELVLKLFNISINNLDTKIKWLLPKLWMRQYQYCGNNKLYGAGWPSGKMFPLLFSSQESVPEPVHWKRVSLRRVPVRVHGGSQGTKKGRWLPNGMLRLKDKWDPSTQGFYPSAWACWKAMARFGVNSWKKSLQNWRVEKITTIFIWRVEKIPCSERFTELNLLSSSKRGLSRDLITGTSIFMGKAYPAF